MDTRRLILFVIFSFSIMMLWDSWQHKDAPLQQSATQTDTASATARQLPRRQVKQQKAANLS